MKFVGSEAAFTHLRAWLANEPWHQRWNDLLAAHLPAELLARLARTGKENDISEGHWAQWEGWALEDLMSARFGTEGENLVDAYLARRGWRETGQAKLYFRAIRDSRASLFEIVDRDPGVSMTLRDLVGSQPAVTVLEKLGSLSCKLWDRVAARVVATGGRSYLTGVLIRFEFDAAERLIARLGPQKEIAFIPGQGPPLFAQTWLEHWIERFEHPRAINTDGDDLAFVEVRFAVAAGAAAAIAARLDAAADFERAGFSDASWRWRGSEDATAKPAATAGTQYAVSIMTADEAGRPFRGQVRLDAGALHFEANSVRRGEDGANRLRALLGDLIGRGETKVTPLAELRKQRSTAPRRDLAPSIPPAEQQRILRDFMDQHYRKTLDQPVPSLGGRTPRQCARSKKNRHLVVAWLKLIENNHAHGSAGGADYDASWLWDELGLQRERNSQRDS